MHLPLEVEWRTEDAGPVELPTAAPSGIGHQVTKVESSDQVRDGF